MNTHDAPGDPFGASENEFASEAPQLPPVSVTEMLQRHVALTWPEAVALVAEACHLVIGSDPRATRLPEPGRLLVFADGSMRIGPWRGDMDLVTTARTLHDLLGAAQPPTPLRLFVGTAISSDKFTTVGEFGGALAFYERPDRAGFLRSAYQRFQATPLDMPAPVSQEPVLPQPVPEPVSRRPRKHVGRMAFAAVFLIVFAGGVTLALRMASARPDSGDLPTLKSVSDRATIELTGLKTKLRDMGLPISVDETAPVPVKAVESEPPPPAAPRQARARAVERAPLPAAPVTAPVALPAVIDPGPPPTAATRQESASEVPPAAAASVAQGVVEAPDVFSVDSAGVTPPVPVSPRVMPSNLQVSGTPALNRMELIIAPDGSVEQVRMLSPLERLPDMMLLSGAKNWRFKPAMKDGQPVRYRLPLTWALSPR